VILSVLSAGVVAGAFGLLFNVRGKNVLFAGINGSIGYSVFTLIIHLEIASFIAMFFASITMAVFAEIAARIRKAPASLFLVAALIPIVPGGGIFQFVLYILQGLRDAATSTGINALMETGGIAVGVIIVSSVIKMIPRRKTLVHNA